MINFITTHIETKFASLEKTNQDPEYIEILKNFLNYLRKKEMILELPKDQVDDEDEEVMVFLSEDDIDLSLDKTKFFLKFIYGYKDEKDLADYPDIDLYMKERRDEGEKVLKEFKQLKPFLSNDKKYEDFERKLLDILKKLKIYTHVN